MKIVHVEHEKLATVREHLLRISNTLKEINDPGRRVISAASDAEMAMTILDTWVDWAAVLGELSG